MEVSSRSGRWRGSRRWLLLASGLVVALMAPSRVPGSSPGVILTQPEDLAPHVPGRLLVKFAPGAGAFSIESLHRAASASVKGRFPAAPGLELVEVAEGSDLPTLMSAYRGSPDVEYVEPDYLFTLNACPQNCRTPNDPRFSEQWGLHNAGQGTQDPGSFQCLGGPDSGASCTSDASCRHSCTDNGAPCFSDTDCDGNCSLDDAPCNFDWQCNDHCSNNFAACNFDSDCGGGFCSDNQAPCTYDWQCQKKCSNNGAPCTYDWQCGSRLCQGGADNGQPCTTNFDCDDRVCQLGTNPGQSCTSDFQCGATCRNGTHPGQSCNDDFQCGSTCQGGSNPGATCSNDFQCFNGGDCVQGDCVHGTCSQPGVCGPQPTCNQPTCQVPHCNPSVCENPTCITHSCGTIAGVSDFDIDAPEAWFNHTSSPQAVIASIDSGVQLAHEDMSPAWVNPGEVAGNGIDDDQNGFVDDVNGWDFVNNDASPADDNWHGTFTMGIAAARGNNGLGIAGVTWSAKIMALKACNASGQCATSALVAAVDYATQMGADVTNNSYESPTFSQSLKDAIDRAGAAGVLFVAAAGNGSHDIDITPAYPAAYASPNIISVASVTRFSLLSDFSNWGRTSVDLGAPGSEILSTTPYPHKYGYESGTSFAAPHVAGAVAYLYGYNPSLTSTQVRQILLNSVVPDDSLANRSVSGGVLNLRNALTQTPACVPTTCAAQGAQCGTIPNGCGGQLSCGTCSGSSTCQNNTCVCTPTTCAAQGAECGAIPDGCGGQLACGSCQAPDQCQANSCVCVPASCDGRCGTVPDGCGGQLSCGSCGGGPILGPCRQDFDSDNSLCGFNQPCQSTSIVELDRCVEELSALTFMHRSTQVLEPPSSGAATSITVQVKLPGAAPAARYLTILNGGGGAWRVSAARIRVNGVVVIDSVEVGAATGWIDRAVVLQPGLNSIVVENLTQTKGILSIFVTDASLME